MRRVKIDRLALALGRGELNQVIMSTRGTHRRHPCPLGIGITLFQPTTYGQGPSLSAVGAADDDGPLTRRTVTPRIHEEM